MTRRRDKRRRDSAYASRSTGRARRCWLVINRISAACRSVCAQAAARTAATIGFTRGIPTRTMSSSCHAITSCTRSSGRRCGSRPCCTLRCSDSSYPHSPAAASAVAPSSTAPAPTSNTACHHCPDCASSPRWVTTVFRPDTAQRPHRRSVRTRAFPAPSARACARDTTPPWVMASASTASTTAARLTVRDVRPSSLLLREGVVGDPFSQQRAGPGLGLAGSPRTSTMPTAWRRARPHSRATHPPVDGGARSPVAGEGRHR